SFGELPLRMAPLKIEQAHPQGLMNKALMTTITPGNLKRVEYRSNAGSTRMRNIGRTQVLIDLDFPIHSACFTATTVDLDGGIAV
ncbi:MAG: hypothetical protein Q9187_007969, partial [Circinaria calcarea]